MRILFYAVVLASALQGCAQPSVLTRGAIDPESAVPGIAHLFSECKLEELISRYSPSIEFVSPSTLTPLIGTNAVRKYFAGACVGAVRPIMKVEEQRVRLLSPESAVVTGTYSFGRSDRPNAKPWPAFFVISLSRADGRWLIGTQATFPIPEPSQ